MAVICPDCKSENLEDSVLCKTCGTPMTPAETPSSLTKTISMPQEPPEKDKLFANRYQILSTLGRGGMGDVYKVHDTKLQEDMALKLLRPEIAFDPDIIQRFRNELKLARKITHKNVCRVFDFHEQEGTPFITMEYVEGEDLKSFIKQKGKIEEIEAIPIASQIVAGLAEAHELGVVHRDLKPQNIMIEPSGRAKVMDFGIARSIQASGLTQTGQIVGTPDYVSSEQAAGLPADHRADIYALGVMLYEMTTGRLPFEGDTALSVITQHREKAPKDPRDINPDISTGLSNLILRCMEKEKENRYQSARELQKDLRSLSEGVEPKITARKTRGGLFKDRKWIAPVGITAIAAIAAAVILFQFQGRNPSLSIEPERPSLAVVYFENNTGDENLSHWRKGFAELLTTDLSQSKFIKVLSGDQVYKILEDLDQLETPGYSSDILKQVAQRGRVRHVLRGSYTKAGSRFRVSISLQDMETGKLVASQTAEAEGEDKLFALVDDLTRGIKSDMNLTLEQIASDIDKQSAEVLTSSPEAYKLFVEGLRYQYRAEYFLCIEYMDRAIAVDPDFAAAHLLKAFAYDSAGYHQEFVIVMTKAFELRHKASERARFQINAYYYMRIENDIPKAQEVLQRFIELYPEDIFANHMNGYFQFLVIEDYEKAVEYLQYNVDNRVNMFYSYYIMAWTEMCRGNYEKAREVCELHISMFSDHPEMRFCLAIYYLCIGDFDQALVEAEKASKLGFAGTHWDDLITGGIFQAKGDIAEAEARYRNMANSRDVLSGVMGRENLGLLALLQGRFKEAESQYKQALDLNKAAGDEANMSRLYSHLAYIGLQTGNYNAALEACSKALEHGSKSIDAMNASKLALHLQGITQLAMGRTAAALKTSEELKFQAEQGSSQRAMKDYLHLAGSIAMKEGNTGNAISFFEKAAALLPAQNQDDLGGFKWSLRRTIYLASLAEAHFRAGHMNQARQACKVLTSLTIGHHYWGDLYVKAFYWLGQISEEQGKPEEAAGHYHTFLKLWENADPDNPELSDARERLDLLEN
jgi:serine/threonine protein kinase/tetratricopeptide (TPR) repeat protein